MNLLGQTWNGVLSKCRWESVWKLKLVRSCEAADKEYTDKHFIQGDRSCRLWEIDYVWWETLEIRSAGSMVMDMPEGQ